MLRRFLNNIVMTENNFPGKVDINSILLIICAQLALFVLYEVLFILLIGAFPKEYQGELFVINTVIVAGWIIKEDILFLMHKDLLKIDNTYIASNKHTLIESSEDYKYLYDILLKGKIIFFHIGKSPVSRCLYLSLVFLNRDSYRNELHLKFKINSRFSISTLLILICSGYIHRHLKAAPISDYTYDGNVSTCLIDYNLINVVDLCAMSLTIPNTQSFNDKDKSILKEVHSTL